MTVIPERRLISSTSAPQPEAPWGPHTHAVVVPPFVFTAGQLPIDQKTGIPLEGWDAEELSRTVLSRIAGILEDSGSGMDRLVKVRVLMVDMSMLDVFNQVYATFVTSQPARAVAGVSELPYGSLIQMDAIALLRP